MGIVQTDPRQSCRDTMMTARAGSPLFRFAGECRLRFFLRGRNNSVRGPNTQPAPVTGLFKGFGALSQQAETAVSGDAGNRSFEPLWEQGHCLQLWWMPQNEVECRSILCYTLKMSIRQIGIYRRAKDDYLFHNNVCNDGFVFCSWHCDL